MVHAKMIIHIVERAAHGLHLDGIAPGIAIGQQRRAAQFVAQKLAGALEEVALDPGQEDVEHDSARPTAIQSLEQQ
jgi:hypothetical protein